MGTTLSLYEGRLREFVLRDGKRWDMLHMGILQEERQVLKGDKVGGVI